MYLLHWDLCLSYAMHIFIYSYSESGPTWYLFIIVVNCKSVLSQAFDIELIYVYYKMNKSDEMYPCNLLLIYFGHTSSSHDSLETLFAGAKRIWGTQNRS